MSATYDVSRREKFLRAANTDYAALKRDAKAWEQELCERELWEQTLADGIPPQSRQEDSEVL